MLRRNLTLNLAIATGALLVAAAVDPPGTAAGSAHDAGASAPRQGQYVGATGHGREATLYVARRTVTSAVVEVNCGRGAARVSLRRVKLRKTARGFELESRRRRRVTYNDGHAPETARVVFVGRFAGTGRKARGVVRVRSPHCGGSGPVRWHATYSATPVEAPKPGRYTGPTEQQRELSLYVSGTSIQLAAIEFECGEAHGSTVLNDVDMQRTRRGFAFVLRAHGGVDYSDGYPSENAAVDISGTFNRSGFRAQGRVRVKSPRCGESGQVGWTAKRQPDG